MPFGRIQPPGLVYTIDLSKIIGRTDPRTVEAPIYSNTTNTPFTVDWGDGSSTNFAAGASAFPTHEYAEGAGDVFTVVIRSANGNLPRLMFNRNQNPSDTTNATYAVTSLDHFGGITAGLARLQYFYSCMYTVNMTYCDPRFAGQQNLADLYKCFQNSGINQPIESFCFDFMDGSGTYTFDSAFQNTKINGSIPGGLFRNNAYAVRFAACFYGCSDLAGSIPTGLFDNNTAAGTFGNTFYGCTGLTGSIPSGLFDNTPNVTTFANTFYDCSGLTGSIPSGLFDNTPNVTSFYCTFSGCRGLTGSIPEGLFDNTPNVNDVNSVFSRCSGLTGSIPDGLFDAGTSITVFAYVFNGCSGLTGNIPENLFDKHPGVTRFDYVFAGCSGLDPPPVELWDTTKWANVSSHAYAYNNCKQAMMNLVPSGWK